MNRPRRPLLTSIAALGGVITLASTTGVFAVFTDRATTGTNTFATKGLPRAADLQVANGDIVVDDTTGVWTVNCGTYGDNLATGLVTMTNAVPNDSFATDFVCVKNAGSQTVDVAASTIDVSDEDTDCTGDEAVVDDTCGVAAGEPDGSPGQAGELSPLLKVTAFHAECSDANQGGTLIGTVPNAIVGIATLAPGATVCVRFGIDYNPTEAEAQVAQSDTATWRFAFDGTVPTT